MCFLTMLRVQVQLSLCSKSQDALKTPAIDLEAGRFRPGERLPYAGANLPANSTVKRQKRAIPWSGIALFSA
jgi:hypothetical protein